MKPSFAPDGLASMSPCRIRVRRTGAEVAAQVQRATSIRRRLVGLLGRTALAEGEGLFLPGCRAIHTFGMRMSIDAIFVDRQWRVVAYREQLRPWRMPAPVWGAWGVLEVAPGTVRRVGLHIGDQLSAEG